MAERRMISKKVVESDRFSSLPSKAKILYFYMILAADDDGFIGNSKNVMRISGANRKSLEALILNDFVIMFDSGALVIRHWIMQNKVAKDRYNRTPFQKEYETLTLDTSGVYHSGLC